MDSNVRNRLRESTRKDNNESISKLPSNYQSPRSVYAGPRPFAPVPEKPKQKHTKLWVLIMIIVLVVIVGGVYYTKFYKSNSNEVSQPAQEQKTESVADKPTEKKSVKLIATGDMIAHQAILEQGKKPNGTYDFTPMLANMKQFFDKADVRFCNQATPAGGASFGYSGYPVFNAPIEWPRAIEGVGCNVVNIGTNHTNDKGQALVDATAAAWDDRSNVLAAVGANRSAEEQAKIRYFKQDGVKFAILSYTTYSNSKPSTTYGINMYDKLTAARQITEAKKGADIVLVSMRWGTEYSPSVNGQQNQISQELADAGADIVLGHGPHVLEPVKKFTGKDGNQTLVWFSLGNFLNAQIETEALIGGFAIMDIDIASKKISDPKFMPTYMHYEWTPAQKAANDLLARKNFQMYALDQAADPMSKSQIGTTVEAQTERVQKVLNTYTPVTIIKSNQF